MEILGIGAYELIFIFIIALIVLGPKDIQKAGRTVGRWLNQLIRSDGWKAFQQTSSEIRNLPNRLMREANNEITGVERDIQNQIGPSPFAYQSRQPQKTDNPVQPDSANLNSPTAGLDGEESNAEDGVGSKKVESKKIENSVESKVDADTTDQNA